MIYPIATISINKQNYEPFSITDMKHRTYPHDEIIPKNDQEGKLEI